MPRILSPILLLAALLTALTACGPADSNAETSDTASETTATQTEESTTPASEQPNLPANETATARQPAEPPAPAQPTIPYTIVTTTGMVTDAVTQIAGDRAEVIGLIGSGIDPHLYSPTRSDVRRIMEADVIFYNGLLLEGKMTDALIRAASSGKRVVAVTEAIDEEYLLEPEDFEGLYDPHVWMDPRAWIETIGVISETLTAFDPEGTEIYTTNAAAYAQQIRTLDAYAVQVLSTVSESQRVLITAHDAFNYFGARFGFEVLGIQGLSTESEAGVQDIERLVSLIVTQQIPAVFIESTVSERNINALVTGARARAHQITIGGELFSDAMGEPGTYEGTYIGMIDHNITTIARALGGRAPERGMNGRLATDNAE